MSADTLTEGPESVRGDSFIEIDTDDQIPNNVALSSDKQLQRALETWRPKYLDWWQDMGPEGFQNSEVYLRTAVGVDPSGWAKFGYVKMPEYRWGVLLAPRVEGRAIPCGRHKGDASKPDGPAVLGVPVDLRPGPGPGRGDHRPDWAAAAAGRRAERCDRQPRAPPASPLACRSCSGQPGPRPGRGPPPLDQPQGGSKFFSGGGRRRSTPPRRWAPRSPRRWSPA